MSTATVRTPKPPSAHIDDQAAENIPSELRDIPRWVAWRWELRPDSKGELKWTKPPINPLDGHATDATDKRAWMTFDEAVKLSRECGDGIGLALGNEGKEQLVGIDLDKCIDEHGTIAEWAAKLVQQFDSYTERTPSGRGLRVWIHGVKPGRKCSKKSSKSSVEIYSRDRYLTVTGRIVDGMPLAIATRQAALDELYGAMFGAGGNHQGNGQAVATPLVDVSDEALLDKARSADNGPGFKALYDQGDISGHGDDNSAAHMGLMNHLAFWTGKDSARMERLFASSALGSHEKWK